MAIQYIQLQEAATMLGVSPEELTDMIGRREIFGYRDGSTWKFKQEEIQRVMEEKGLGAKPPSLDDVPDSSDDEVSFEKPLLAGLDFGDDDEVDASAKEKDADVLAGNELDDAGADIGLGDGGLGDGLSDLELSLEDDDADVLDTEPSSGDSDSILVSEEELGKSDDNTASTIIGDPDDLVKASDGDSHALGGSDLELKLESSITLGDQDPGTSDILGDGEIDLGPSDTSNLDTEASGELKLEDSGSLDLSLEDSVDGGSRISLSDDDASTSGFGSAIDLGLEDDELVLGSGSGSDITAGAGDSGINLANPADSGLSLEEPLDLTGGSGIESLELGEDDMLVMDDDAGDDEGDAQFMLTPVEDGLDEESDSGSQVIAIADDDEFGGEAIDMVEDDAFADAGGLEADGGFDDDVAATSPPPQPAAGVAAASAREEEASYSIWNVLSLFIVVGLLGFTGILMTDLINNIWSWDGNFSFNSSIMDAILSMMPG